jgi:hypothetical protein
VGGQRQRWLVGLCAYPISAFDYKQLEASDRAINIVCTHGSMQSMAVAAAVSRIIKDILLLLQMTRDGDGDVRILERKAS